MSVLKWQRQKKWPIVVSCYDDNNKSVGSWRVVVALSVSSIWKSAHQDGCNGNETQTNGCHSGYIDLNGKVCSATILFLWPGSWKGFGAWHRASPSHAATQVCDLMCLIRATLAARVRQWRRSQMGTVRVTEHLCVTHLPSGRTLV